MCKDILEHSIKGRVTQNIMRVLLKGMGIVSYVKYERLKNVIFIKIVIHNSQ